MRRLLVMFALVWLLICPAEAVEFSAPAPPESAADAMPESDSFGQGLMELLMGGVEAVTPDLHSAVGLSLCCVAAVITVSCVQIFSGGNGGVCQLAGIAVLSALLLTNTDSILQLSSRTLAEITQYGKLLLPVMAAALAAQGGVSSAAGLYAGTAVFNSLVGGFMTKTMLPMVYCYLALSVTYGAVGESMLKNLRDMLKTVVSWCLKTVLAVYTAYMSITGVVSGTTDAAALKATKLAISSFVPVIGGILSDASEAVLVSAALARNTAGIYGIFAILAIFLTPFLRIGLYYLVLKATGMICGVFECGPMCGLLADFACAMGLMLAMTASACLIQLISTVCFLKGVGI